jgi:hypothetical protein
MSKSKTTFEVQTSHEDLDQFISAYSEDFVDNNCFIKTDAPNEVGTILVIKFLFNSGKTALKLNGVVTEEWSRKTTKPGMRVQIKDASKAHNKILEKLLHDTVKSGTSSEPSTVPPPPPVPTEDYYDDDFENDSDGLSVSLIDSLKLTIEGPELTDADPDADTIPPVDDEEEEDDLKKDLSIIEEADNIPEVSIKTDDSSGGALFSDKDEKQKGADWLGESLELDLSKVVLERPLPVKPLEIGASLGVKSIPFDLSSKSETSSEELDQIAALEADLSAEPEESLSEDLLRKALLSSTGSTTQYTDNDDSLSSQLSAFEQDLDEDPENLDLENLKLMLLDESLDDLIIDTPYENNQETPVSPVEETFKDTSSLPFDQTMSSDEIPVSIEVIESTIERGRGDLKEGRASSNENSDFFYSITSSEVSKEEVEQALLKKQGGKPE